MQDIYQKTILKPVSFTGVGLHSGVNSTIKLLPASSDKGIVFKRSDIKKNNIIEAKYENVISAKLCTTLENKFGVSVSTVEHLLAAFYITGVDNVVVEVDNKEIPIMDGSSKDFIEVLDNNGFRKLEKFRKFLKINEKIELIENEKSISIEPNKMGLEVDFKLDYKNKIIGKQKNQVFFENKDTLKEIYQSRTFCLFEDIEKIKKSGLAKGGSLENAIVVKENQIMNEDGLRNEKEFVNHKILDLVGDFLLSGYRILGRVKCVHGGHQLSNSFLRKMFTNKNKFSIVDLNKTDILTKYNSITQNKIAVNA